MSNLVKALRTASRPLVSAATSRNVSPAAIFTAPLRRASFAVNFVGGAAGVPAHRRETAPSGLASGGRAAVFARGMDAKSPLRLWGAGAGGERPFLNGNFSNLMASAEHEHQERRLVRYSAEQLFDVVAAVDSYPEFLPWCKDGAILARQGGGGGLTAELSVGFKGLSEKYVSEVALARPRRITATTRDSSLFSSLSSEWEFRSGPGGDANCCWLDFKVNFAFRNPLYNQVAAAFKSEVASKMVSAFEKRCLVLYGPPRSSGASPPF